MHRFPRRFHLLFVWLPLLGGGASAAGCGYERLDLRMDLVSAAGGGTTDSGGAGGFSTGGSSGGDVASGSSSGGSSGGVAPTGGSGAAPESGGGAPAGGGAFSAGGQPDRDGSGGEGGAVPPHCDGPDCPMPLCCEDLLFKCEPGKKCPFPYCEDNTQCRPGTVCDPLTSQCLAACGYCPVGFSRCDVARGNVCSQCFFDYDCGPGFCVQGICQLCERCQ